MSHDPTTLNRQGNDVGKHYRSIILYNDNEENKIITNYTEKINNDLFDNKIVTEIKIPSMRLVFIVEEIALIEC